MVNIGWIFMVGLWVMVSGVKDNFSLIDKLRNDLLQLRDISAGHEYEARYSNDIYEKIVKTYDNFGTKLDQETPNIGKRNLNSLSSLWLWARTQSDMRTIDGLYSTFRQKLQDTVQKRQIFNTQQWIIFADIILNDPKVSVPEALKRISNLIIEQNLFVAAYQEASAQLCNEQQSPQQLLFNLYNTIALTEIKGHTMMQFSYSLLRLYKNGTFDEEINKTSKDFDIRTSETLKAVRTAMAFAPNELWRCDPHIHEEGKTYEELKQVFQGYIVNEVDLNPKESCFQNCGYYNYAKVYGCLDTKQCSQQRTCNGEVLHCQYVDSDMWICPSERNSSRRYEYIEYENGKQYGQKGTCKRPTTKVDSWWRYFLWHCSYCMCFCDEYNPSSDRYFNLRDITSDVANNKVITGIKLTKKNQIIHIQIQEGKLLPRGIIDESSVNWKPVENFTTTSKNITNGRDFHKLSWDRRAIDMDDLVAPDQQLLTGARFRMVGAHLNFEVRVTPFNFTTGLLIKPMEMSTWISNDNTDFHDSNQLGRRTELVINKPDIPTRTKASNIPDSKSNQFLNFGPTDLEQDAAQTTIPFIDIQPVETNPPFPLSGAGIYHKGRNGFGGYVALKVMTYNFINHLHVELPTVPPVIGMNDIPSA